MKSINARNGDLLPAGKESTAQQYIVHFLPSNASSHATKHIEAMSPRQ